MSRNAKRRGRIATMSLGIELVWDSERPRIHIDVHIL